MTSAGVRRGGSQAGSGRSRAARPGRLRCPSSRTAARHSTPERTPRRSDGGSRSQCRAGLAERDLADTARPTGRALTREQVAAVVHGIADLLPVLRKASVADTRPRSTPGSGVLLTYHPDRRLAVVEALPPSHVRDVVCRRGELNLGSAVRRPDTGCVQMASDLRFRPTLSSPGSLACPPLSSRSLAIRWQPVLVLDPDVLQDHVFATTRSRTPGDLPSFFEGDVGGVGWSGCEAVRPTHSPDPWPAGNVQVTGGAGALPAIALTAVRVAHGGAEPCTTLSPAAGYRDLTTSHERGELSVRFWKHRERTLPAGGAR